MRLPIAVCLALLASLPAWAAEPSWTGQWDTRWCEGGARVQASVGGVALDQAGARQASHVRAGSAAAGVTATGLDGIEVELSCVLDARSADDERTDRTALMLGVLRLAERMRVRLSQHDPMPASAHAAVAA